MRAFKANPKVSQIFHIVRTKFCLHLRKWLTQFFPSTERGASREQKAQLSRDVSRSADVRLRRKNKQNLSKPSSNQNPLKKMCNCETSCIVTESVSANQGWFLLFNHRWNCLSSVQGFFFELKILTIAVLDFLFKFG